MPRLRPLLFGAVVFSAPSTGFVLLMAALELNTLKPYAVIFQKAGCGPKSKKRLFQSAPCKDAILMILAVFYSFFFFWAEEAVVGAFFLAA